MVTHGLTRGLAAMVGGMCLLAIASQAAAHDRMERLKDHLSLGLGSRALVLITEGATDPALFAAVVENPTNEHPVGETEGTLAR